MAHIAKYAGPAAAAMIRHYRREMEATLERRNVDPSRTADNYALGISPDGRVVMHWPPDAAMGWEEVVRRRESVQEATGRRVRKDAVLLADLVVTLPQNVSQGDARAFFEATLEYLAGKVGRDNVLAGYVHMDESRPHMHAAFTPIVGGRFSYKRLCPRSFYQSLHAELGDHLEKRLGYRPEVELDERDEGIKQLSGLSQSDYIAARRALSDAQEEAEEARVEAEAAMRELASLEESVRLARDSASEEAERAARARREADGERDRLERLRRRAGERVRQLEAVRAEKKRVRGEADQLEGECRGLEKLVADLRGRVEAWRKRLVGRVHRGVAAMLAMKRRERAAMARLALVVQGSSPPSPARDYVAETPDPMELLRQLQGHPQTRGSDGREGMAWRL